MSRLWTRSVAPRAPADLDLTERELAPGGLVLRASGELDVATAPALRARLHAAVEDGVRRLVLDFTNVTFVDSLTLAAVVGAQTRMGPGGRLAVVTAQPYVLLILEAGGLDGVLRVFATPEAAEEHVLR